MKEKLWWGFWIAVFACAAVVGWFNLMEHRVEIVDSGLSARQILREMPEIALTEEDFSIQEALLALPEVQPLAEGEANTLPLALAQTAIGEYLPEDAKLLDVSIIGTAVYVDYNQGRERRTILTFFTGGEYPTRKTIANYRKDINGDAECTAIYENSHEGTIEKRVPKRDWLYFLKE